MAKAAKTPADKPIDFAGEFSKFLNSFNSVGAASAGKLSARERIIVTTSFLDELLRFCIVLKMSASRGAFPTKTTMASVFDGTNILASFGDKISFCSAFGLIPPEIKSDLNTLKEMRNHHAAHTFAPLSFDDPEIVVLCHKLQLRLKIVETDYENDNERRFMESAWMVILALLFASMMLIEQQKVMSANIEEVIKAAVTHWNETVIRKLGWPDVEIPPSSPEKSA